MLLTAILGTTLLSGGIDALARAETGTAPCGVTIWRRKTMVSLVFCCLAGLIQTIIVIGVLRVPASGNVLFFLFTVLSLATITMLTLFWTTLAGPRGIVLTILLMIALGVPASGGAAPMEMLPDIYGWLHSWVPLRFVVDGNRAIVLFHGRADAGLQKSTLALLLTAILFTTLSGAIAAARDRRRPGVAR